jgi:sirohydrochlorin ferrochelatase
MPPQGQFSTGSGAPGADFPGSGQLGSGPLGSGQPDNDTLARRQPGAPPHARQPGAPAARQPAARLVAPGGRHRRDMPASLPEGAPALILAVPAVSADGLSRAAAEIATVLRLDNPALDVQMALIDHGGRGDPAGIRSVLADAAARRPAGTLSAVVIPLVVTPYPAAIRELNDAISASGAEAHIGEVFNTNALLAEALHHRLADAGLCRADRVRMFSITTSADGIILATVGGEEAVGTASITAFLLSARLALPVVAASLDAKPTVEDAARQLHSMGVTRIALAPCLIGPEADPAAIADAAVAIGAKCAAPLGAHGNVVKLMSQAYGQVLRQFGSEGPDAQVSPPGGRHR